MDIEEIEEAHTSLRTNMIYFKISQTSESNLCFKVDQSILKWVSSRSLFHKTGSNGESPITIDVYLWQSCGRYNGRVPGELYFASTMQYWDDC